MLHPKHKIHILRALIGDLHKIPPHGDDTPGFEDEYKSEEGHDVEGQVSEGGKLMGLHKDNSVMNSPLHNEEPNESSMEEAKEKGEPGEGPNLMHKPSHAGSVSKGKGNPEIASEYEGPHVGEHPLQGSMKLRKPIKKVTGGGEYY